MNPEFHELVKEYKIFLPKNHLTLKAKIYKCNEHFTFDLSHYYKPEENSIDVYKPSGASLSVQETTKKLNNYLSNATDLFEENKKF
jgi:hypothetical protein